MSRTWEIRLPWTAPPASANDRDHWRVKAKKVAEIRAAAADIAHYYVVMPADDWAEPPHIRVGLLYVPRDRRRRDPDNLVVPLFKALVDGIVDAGIVPDDTPRYVTREFPVIAEPDGDPRLVLRIEEVP
jgi:crossover junction endodeoxyribonuclease RusA